MSDNDETRSFDEDLYTKSLILLLVWFVRARSTICFFALISVRVFFNKSSKFIASSSSKYKLCQ